MKIRNNFFILIILGLILRLFLSIQIYSGDVNNHIAWGKDIQKNGIKGVYSREFFPTYGTLAPTYPPVPLYLFTTTYALYDWVYKTTWDLNNTFPLFPSNLIFFLEDQDTLPAFMKIPAIISDVMLAAIVYLFTKKLIGAKDKTLPLITSSLILFNPAFFYNSSYWGQIESIPILFVISSFYFLLFTKRNFLTVILFVLAILTKQTSIVFIPVFAIIYYFKFGLKISVKGIFKAILIFWISFLPFHDSGNILSFPITTYWNKIQTGSGSIYVTDHAFNFWALITGLGKIEDTKIWFIQSYRIWGYLIFFIISGLILLKLYKNRNKYFVFFASFLISTAAFLFLTRMHERYLLQALPFLLLMGVKKRSLLISFLFLSIFYFLNLYHNWWAPRIPILVNFISSGIVINSLIIATISLFIVFLLQYIKGSEKYD